ncbi:MAG: methylamine utilization protein MauG [Pelagimonas sp.]|jgi:cytochrome c peroxidase|nr:methylamine utilization protein MauG [Pelagimonas sp.]
MPTLRPTRHLSTLLFAAAASFATLSAHADPLFKQDFIRFDPKQAQLGQLLFYDKILSGNQNISCGTCHHHDLGGTDGLSLGIGEGGQGLGPDRSPGEGVTRVSARIPRNAPALWNLGAKEVRTMFHDGRVEQIDHKSARFETPAGEQLPLGLNSVLAAQVLFPMSSDAEMAGTAGENPVGRAFEKSFTDGWSAVAERVKSVPGYPPLFKRAFPHLRNTDDITIAEVANALAAFIGTEWQSNDSPYDDYLNRGTPLSAQAEAGRELFFGDAGCVQCHSGPLFSDQEFHALGLPNFGPGRAFKGQNPKTDVGRMEVTGLEDDAYRFRTPSLRNVALTAPYGHNGAYPTLDGMIRHMLTPQSARAAWTPELAGLPSIPWLDKDDFSLLGDDTETARQIAFVDLEDKAGFSDADVQAIEAFLHALTGKSAESLPMGRPDSVPSGLPVD